MKILIVSYTYPPSKNIGGRRWSKFSKYLHKSGNEVFLLTLKPDNFNKNKIDYPNISKTYYLNNYYPKILGEIPTSILEKVRYRLALVFVKFVSKGNFYDKSIFLKKQFLNKCGDIIESNNIEQVIITGAPFRLLHFGTLLKEKYNIKLLSDIRDPWTWGEGYGMKLLSPKRKKKEILFEKTVMDGSDIITVPVSPMLDYLVKNYSQHSGKIKLLSHAFDSDDYSLDEGRVEDSKKYRLIYGGTIYRGLDEEFESVYEFCKENKGGDFSLEIYTNRFQYLDNQKIKEIAEKFKISPYVFPTKLMQKIKNADAYLLIFPDEVKDFISTKFYEIIYCKTPIIYVGSRGVVSDFIIENNLGVHILPQNLKKELGEITSGKKKVLFDQNFPIDNYSFEKITKDLLGIMKF